WDDLALPATMRRGPFHLAPIEQLDRSVLPALHYQVAAEQDRRRRAQVRVARFELRGVDRRVVAEQLGGARVELEHGVPPVAASVPGPIAGRDEDAPGVESMTAPARPQMAEPLAGQLAGFSNP